MTRKLRTQFDAAHRDGLRAMNEVDFKKLGAAIARKRDYAW